MCSFEKPDSAYFGMTLLTNRFHDDDDDDDDNKRHATVLSRIVYSLCVGPWALRRQALPVPAKLSYSTSLTSLYRPSKSYDLDLLFFEMTQSVFSTRNKSQRVEELNE